MDYGLGLLGTQAHSSMKVGRYLLAGGQVVATLDLVMYAWPVLLGSMQVGGRATDWRAW